MRKIPWLTTKSIEAIAEYLTPEMNVLEFGSGASTHWFSKRCKQVCTFEHHDDWAEQIREVQEEGKLENVFLYNFPRDYSIQIPLCFSSEEFDLVVVDGRDRVNCVKKSIEVLKPGGMLVLDNAERPEYKEALDLLPGHEVHEQFSPDEEGFFYQGWQTITWLKC